MHIVSGTRRWQHLSYKKPHLGSQATGNRTWCDGAKYFALLGKWKFKTATGNARPDTLSV